MRRPAAPRRRCLGLSLLEVLVGLAIGLFVAAGATTLLTQFLGENRRLLLRMRVEQQVHAVAGVVLRDLRRAGHWAQAHQGIARAGEPGAANPGAAIEDADPDTPSNTVRFSFSGSGGEADPSDGEPDDATGFRLLRGQVDAGIGGRWQPLTDPAVVTVTAFELTLRQRALDLERHCARPRPLGACTGAGACPPRLLRRSVALRLEAQSAQDPSIRHAFESSVDLRNDVVEGRCPE
jgi:type IV pilus assembly protein PilW